MENLFFLIPLFFIIILVLPLLVKIKLSIDAKSLTGIMVLYLWNIKIRIIRVYVKDNKIFMYSKKKKEIKFSFSSKSVMFMQQFISNLKDKIQPRQICVYSKIGTSDAKNTAVINGNMLILLKTLFCYIKNKKPMCSIDYKIYPSFNNDCFLVCVYSSFVISIFDVLFSFICSVFSLRRYYGKQWELYWWFY